MDTLSYGKRKANKEHKCDFCNGVIKKGETYKCSTHVDDEIYTWKSHLHCMELVSLLKMDYDLEGITEDCFYEYVNEYFQDEYTLDEKAKMSFDKLSALEGKKNELSMR